MRKQLMIFPAAALALVSVVFVLMLQGCKRPPSTQTEGSTAQTGASTEDRTGSVSTVPETQEVPAVATQPPLYTTGRDGNEVEVDIGLFGEPTNGTEDSTPPASEPPEEETTQPATQTQPPRQPEKATEATTETTEATEAITQPTEPQKEDSGYYKPILRP